MATMLMECSKFKKFLVIESFYSKILGATSDGRASLLTMTIRLGRHNSNKHLAIATFPKIRASFGLVGRLSSSISTF